MNKNIYIKPALEEIVVETEAVMSGSISFDNDGATGGRAKEHYPKGMHNWQED